jgi:hypothetical protein
MRRKYESEEKTGVAVEGKRGKGKARAQACTPDGYSNIQYQTTTPSFSDSSQQSAVQPVIVGEYQTHTSVGLDVYEVGLSHCFLVEFFPLTLTESRG